jgi:hypothetical protein
MPAFASDLQRLEGGNASFIALVKPEMSDCADKCRVDGRIAAPAGGVEIATSICGCDFIGSETERGIDRSTGGSASALIRVR